MPGTGAAPRGQACPVALRHQQGHRDGGRPVRTGGEMFLGLHGKPGQQFGDGRDHGLEPGAGLGDCGAGQGRCIGRRTCGRFGGAQGWIGQDAGSGRYHANLTGLRD